MNCREVDELIGAYAVDAVTDAEARDVRQHVRTCARHAAEAYELRRTARRLAAGAEPTAPPAPLRARVLAAVSGEPDNARRPLRIDEARRRGGRDRWWLWMAGAAAAIAIGGLLAWNVVLLRGGNELARLGSRAQVVAVLQASGAEGGGAVLYFPDERKALVIGNGLKPLDPAAGTYQLWEIDGGQPTSIGLMQADASGHATALVPYTGGAGHTLAITVEPAGGSRQPTSSPIYVAKV